MLGHSISSIRMYSPSFFGPFDNVDNGDDDSK